MAIDDEAQRAEGGASIREQAQIDLILGTVPDVAPYPPDWRDSHDGVEYLYRSYKIIVRYSNLESVQRHLREREVPNEVDTDTVLAGATRLTLEGTDVLAELERIEAEEGLGAAGLDHLFYVCVHCCAADEPEAAPADAVPLPRPQIGQDAANPSSGHGARVQVRIMDTGLLEGAADSHYWMAGVTGDVDNPYGQNGQIRQDGGHGTFVAGCVRVTAPEAEVHVVNATAVLPRKDNTDEIGAVFESDLAALVRSQLVANEGEPSIPVPDILVLNFAGTTRSGRPPVALAALYDNVIHHLKELLILSPAGNEGDSRKNWPASFAWVVSVGALAENWRDLASWSNHGRHVDVYAPGERLVNAFVRNEEAQYMYTWDDPPPNPITFDGMARWSGTSFSTPLVAGLVAARMSTTDQTSRRAWASLLELGEGQGMPGLGPVLYPGQEFF